MNMLYYIPAVLGVVFIVVGTYHGWKLRTLTRHCTAATTGKLLGFEEKKLKGERLFHLFNINNGLFFQVSHFFVSCPVISQA